ncbi:MAG: hypothetical protein ABFE13_19220 [Phycisphaerales bacterium]
MLIVSALPLVHGSAVATHGGQEEVGELRIEGEGLKEVILKDEAGRRKTIDQFDSPVTLSEGEYSIQSITLQGDHSSSYSQIPGGLRVVADANAVATLRIGAPLRQVVKVERQGPVIVLNYELIGRGGEQYRVNRTQDCPGPSFTAYRGEREVGSGKFEFG